MKSFSAIIILFLFAEYTTAQFTNVMIEKGSSYGEPAVCINPKNSNQIVAGALLNIIYTSSNGGQTWNTSWLNSTYGVYGDPCFAADTAGNFYTVHLSNASGSLERILCQKSTDGGNTWSNGTSIGFDPPKKQDKPWLCSDHGNIYVSWTESDNVGSNNPNDSSVIMFSKSTDAGTTFSTAKRVSIIAGNCSFDPNSSMDDMAGSAPCVGPNGEIYISWSGKGIRFQKSTDGGNTWLNADAVADTFATSEFFNVPGMGSANSFTSIACDRSGGVHNGNIYICWADQRNGFNNTDVFLATSSNGGATWNTKKINDDNSATHQYHPAMTVDPVTGIIYVIFYDSRNYNDNSTDVYLAYSTDGGNNFTNVLISASPFVPYLNNPIDTAMSGDYNGISAFNNIVRPVWGRTENGQMAIMTALINNIATNASEQQNNFSVNAYPNPSSDEINISVNLREEDFLSVKLYDLLGKEVATLSNEKRSAGNNSFTFSRKENHLPEGIYLLKIKTSSKTEVRKIVFE